MIKLFDLLFESSHPDFKRVVKDYISLTDPEREYYPLNSSEQKRLDKIELDAAENGYLDDLQTASYKSHFPRHDIQGSDKLKSREWWIQNTKNRITKNGKLSKNSAKWLKNTMKRDKTWGA